MGERDPAVNWLLQSEDPSIIYLTRKEILGEDDSELARIRRKIPSGPKVRALLSGQRPDGGFGVHPYRKWTGSHWRLVSLVQLCIPVDNKRARKAAREVANWLSRALEKSTTTVGKYPRKHASIYGNALGTLSYLGMAHDRRVRLIAESLIKWQWPDGGWNCDPNPEVRHSSFYESLSTLWGLTIYEKEAGGRQVSNAVERASELFLSHRLFRSHRSGKVVNSQWLKLHYPLYWHYDVLQALNVLSLSRRLSDPRVAEALDIVERKRTREGFWVAEGFYWHPVTGVRSSCTDIVDWGRKGPNQMITLNALRVLKVAGRFD